MDHSSLRINNLLDLSKDIDLLKQKEYHSRFCKEWRFFIENECMDNILFAYYIKSIISSFNIPFFIRGSAGGSLVLFLLGFTSIDPVKHNILFERFMNSYRDTLGDIDFDVPRNNREEIFSAIYHYFSKTNVYIGRISTRVYYKQNSAIREVLRRIYNYRKTIPRDIMENSYKMMKYFKANYIAPVGEVLNQAQSLVGKLRYSSAHIGGLVLLGEGENYLPSKRSYKCKIPLVDVDKQDVDRDKRFKIDVLSNSGLDIIKMIYPEAKLDEKHFPYCQEVFDMIGRGDTIGIFYGESPLSKNAFILYHQKYGISSIEDIAKCISMIRPMARSARDEVSMATHEEIKTSIVISKENPDKKERQLIFDDDWIFELSKLLHINLESADKARRNLSKGDQKTIEKLFKKVSIKRLRQLMQIQYYGFCKSHAVNYAQLIYCQAYAKWKEPLKFHCAVLNTLGTGRIYSSWVYYLDALKKGIKIYAWKKNDKYIIKKGCIQPKAGIQVRLTSLLPSQEIKQFGGITSLKNIYDIQGEVACSRKYKGIRFYTELNGLELIDKIEEIK